MDTSRNHGRAERSRGRGTGRGGNLPAVVLRPAQPGDAPAIAAIYAHYVAASVATFDEEAPGPEVFAERIERVTAAGLPFLVAESGDAVEGFGYVWRYRDRAAYRHTVEDSLYVAPDACGRGIGRALLAALVAAAEAAGKRQVVAVIADTGEPGSVELHRALGFREAGRLEAVGHKHGRWVDVLFMQRSLGAGTA